MSSSKEKAELFRSLHHNDSPLIIYNVWDGGSAKTVAGCGAKALATGDHPVGFAHGFGDEDFDEFTFDIYLPTIEEVVARSNDLPVSVDISNGSGLTPEELKERVKIVISAGAIGVNFEDTVDDESGLRSIDEQVERIKAIREAANEVDVPLFINARTDLFGLADDSDHKDLIDEAAERAAAYEMAGADGLFTPKLLDVELIKQLVSKINLPLNIIRLPGAPSSTKLAEAGVKRISYGPVPQMRMTEWLKEQASTALSMQE